ncbi:hypothetical protein [Streptomyces sp. NPDC050388]|uniref:hypothetical protein n=1 Tax=Streptomyces sp. NPDC050388 TaxID=3155781 RepID=UPI003438FE9F
MLLLTDRNFSGDEFLNDVADTGAQLLTRLTYHRRPAVISVLPDGSYLTRLRGRTFRIIEADVTANCADGETEPVTIQPGVWVSNTKTPP